MENKELIKPGTFIKYLQAERNAFCEDVGKQEWNTQMRTSAENILIAYDQVVDKFLKSEGHNKELKDDFETIKELKEKLETAKKLDGNPDCPHNKTIFQHLRCNVCEDCGTILETDV